MALPRSLVAAASVNVFLAACAGTGEDGGSTVQDVPFTSFQAVQPNQVVSLNGTAQTASGTMSGSTVTGANLGPAGEDGTLRLTFDGSGNVSGINFSSPSASRNFDSVTCRAGVCAAETATSTVAGVDAKAVGWDYQTFGVWLDRPTAATFQAGAMSAGAPTPGNAVPTTGTANFSGGASGFYVDAAGTAFGTLARMEAAVDFATQNISFSTNNTTTAELDGPGTPNSASGLNLSGSLTYAPGVNRFTGAVNAQDPSLALSGSATGRFYGPQAQEMGGTYGLTGAGPSRMIGGFGAKQ